MGDGANGSGDGVGDVVELEVEEDIEAAVAKQMHEVVASGVVELHADFEPLAGVVEAIDEFEGGFGVRIVQRHRQALPGIEVFVGGGHELSVAPVWRIAQFFC